MHRMWEKIRPETEFKETRAHTQRRDPLPVSSLPQEIQPEFELEGPHPEKAPRPISVRTKIRMHRMSGEICDETRIGETSESIRSFDVLPSQLGIGDGGFQRRRSETEREIGSHRFTAKNR